MPPERLARVFEFDFKAADKRMKMGFGLARDCRIIQDHNGEIQAESRVGEGTQMAILLPVKS